MNQTALLSAVNNVSKFGDGIKDAALGEKVTFSLQVVLIGMGVVFGVLLLLIGVLQLFKLFAIKPAKKNESEPITPSAPVSAPVPTVASASSEEEKIVAIASSAIAASRGESEVNFTVLSIAPIGAPVANASVPAAAPAPASAPAPAPVKASAPAPVVAGDGEKVNAPLPGNILDVKVANGASVKKGDILCILEAMKMENEIVAPVDGTIVTAVATKGSSVNTGDLLFVIG